MSKNRNETKQTLSNEKRERYNYWLSLFEDAKAKRCALVDMKFELRNKLYRGECVDNITKSVCHRNMCFELIEAQINNAQPMPKITPTNSAKQELAQRLETFLRLEMDRLQSERINDRVERGVLKQGTHFYEVGWDETLRHGANRGGITLTSRAINEVWPQPGVVNFYDCQYVFVYSREQLTKIKKLTGLDAPESPNFKGLVEIITTWYYDDDGYVCRFAWAKDTDFVLFDDRDFESRRVRVCTECGYVTNDDVCPVCGSTKFTTQSVHEETLREDIIKGNPADGTDKGLTIARAGDKIEYYAIKQIPLVIRINISSDDSMYGISDIDLLETNQRTNNDVTTKIRENILKAGSIITVPKKVNMKLNNETLKLIRVDDPKIAGAIKVQNLQANTQQDDILADRTYQFARSSLGITDSYQGKRDPTAESGKAKEISAQQASGRLESKRRMKDAAYADLYQMMFYFFLAYCDNAEMFVIDQADGSITNGKIRRYDFLEGTVGDLYYDDAMVFSVDTASVLYTSRDAMWRETTNNFVVGTMGNPADPQAQLLYWTVMKDLNYPLAKTCLDSLTARLKAAQAQALAEQQAMQQQLAAMTGKQGGVVGKVQDGRDEQLKAAISKGMKSANGGQKK